MDENDKECRWRTPNGIIRKMSIRKEFKRRQSLSTLSLNSSNVLPSSKSCAAPAKVKSTNPFAKKRALSETTEPSKKRVVSLSDFKDYSQHGSPTNGDIGSDRVNPESSSELPFVYLEEDSIQGLFNQVSVKEAFKPLGKKSLPMDWTLKRKARFLSSNSFIWCGRTKGSEDANAVAQALRCIHNDIAARPSFSEPSEEVKRSWRVELNKLLTYWQQPSIPWLNLFPRFGHSTMLNSSANPAIPVNDYITNAMQDCWAVSFRSILQLTKEGLCPFFYVCGQQYTALFRACTVGELDDITCMLTPTTMGLRQLLKNEGIEFTRSGAEKENSSTDDTSEDKENLGSDTISNDITEDTTVNPADDDQTWDLINQSIKLNGLKGVVRNNQNAETSTSDSIFVTGNTNIQLLSNYLLTSKTSISKSGSQAHIPPTILAPIAFEGASLKKLSVRSGIARSFSESTSNGPKLSRASSSLMQYSLDISGPLLPHCILGLHNLLAKTQGSLGYKAALSTSLYTVPFNTSFNLNSDRGSTNAQHSYGLSEAVTEILHSRDSKPICLNHILLDNGLYTWNA